MWTIGTIGFATPLLLLALIALPILWLLLRAVPPAPVRRRFPGVALLLGLQDDESQSDRTPWWLLLLRMLAVAAAIIAFAGPILNPKTASDGTGPLLIVADGTWSDARDWQTRIDRIDALLVEAARLGRPAAIATLTDLQQGMTFQSADATRRSLANLSPQPWEPDADALLLWLADLEGSFDTYWLSDGLDRLGRDALLEAFQDRGAVTVFQTPRQTFGLRPAQYEDGAITLSAVRTPIGREASIDINAIGLDPSGVERLLATVPIAFGAGNGTADVSLVLPPELRNRVTRFEIAGIRSAGAVSLTDDALKRREVALIAGSGDREGLELLSPLFYLREALEPTADLIDGTLDDILLANPDVIVLADVANLSASEDEAIATWVNEGGLLLRFAGPRLAASDIGRANENALLPVRLRSGGRTVGGAMSWGEPKSLAPFDDGSPFFGLPIPEDVTVSSQVMAQPDPTLAARVIAGLADGTPLVTRKVLGEGQVVLFHVTANAEWSSLPLSGLFVQMLERLAVSTRPSAPEAEALEGTSWVPVDVMDASGRLNDGSNMPSVDGLTLAQGKLSPDVPPGVYRAADQRIALNVIALDTTLATAQWPANVDVLGMGTTTETPLKGWLLAAALALLSIDVVASLAIGGRLRGPRADVAAATILALCLVGTEAQAQDDDFAIAATAEVVLGYVLTGDAETDDISQAGLRGLSQTLFRRTSIEPGPPLGLDLERDELAFFPFIYWPITPNQALPSREAYSKLNRYLRSGGMILFDTRDANTARFGSSSAEGQALQAIARTLDIPAIAPIPQDHVLTRTFYLLQDFPGRYASRDIWVEAPAGDAELADGMPFRNLNDGVTPVVIGGNDWARAWAINSNGGRMFPVGRGQAGERQREYAYRFGVNLIMHVLTGNYKSDQVHVPDLLERLGQ